MNQPRRKFLGLISLPFLWRWWPRRKATIDPAKVERAMQWARDCEEAMRFNYHVTPLLQSSRQFCIVRMMRNASGQPIVPGIAVHIGKDGIVRPVQPG